jgi:glyoxylase-like metal-dependent hydrolase (beta-lactamase superfamily II)
MRQRELSGSDGFVGSMSEYPVHIEIEPRVHLIRGAHGARFPQANCLLVDDEVLTIVDAGADINRIRKTLSDLGHQMKDIDRIVLSHFHIDHKAFATEIVKEADCEVLCHPLAEKGVRTFAGMVACYGIDGHRYFDEWKMTIPTWVPHIMSDYPVTGNFQDGVPIDCGEIQLYPIHAPGHTFDHTCFGINGHDTILLVDIDLTRFGPWYGNVVSDIEDFESSIRRIMELDPAVGVSSHLLEPVRSGLQERLVQYLGVIDERNKTIIRLVSEGYDTLEKLANRPTIYPRIPFNLYSVFEEYMVQKHIELLTKRGAIMTDGDRLVAVRS